MTSDVEAHRRRWLMIALAFAATAINYLDRQTLSVAAPVLREQFHMSNVGVFARAVRFSAGVHHHERRLGAADRPVGNAAGIRSVHGMVVGGGTVCMLARAEP